MKEARVKTQTAAARVAMITIMARGDASGQKKARPKKFNAKRPRPKGAKDEATPMTWVCLAPTAHIF